MRKYLKFSIAILVVASMMSCSDKKTRQYQYMPDMYTSVPYKTDGSNGIWKDGMVDSKPVAGLLEETCLMNMKIPMMGMI